MKFKKLGNTDLDVSLICLGTMTWGTQNTEKEAFEQMDYSLEQGVNFFDTAELYSVPPTPDSYGKTEIMIGIRDTGYVEVLSGLIEGENIVAEGLKKVRPMGKIKPIKK